MRIIIRNFAVMKKENYHICLSGGDEVYCRSEEDYIFCFNALALAVHETETSLLADSIMSTHLHECVCSEDPLLLIKRQRYPYTRYFNRKYHRKGMLGQAKPFIMKLDGTYHNLAAITYTFRNALHHGVAPTPFAYRHSSARVIFRKSLGHDEECKMLSPSRQHRHLPYRVKCPPGYRMDKTGLILREDVIDTVYVEHMYSSPRSFLYHMNLLTSEEWIREQEKDRTEGTPITIELIETGVRYQSLGEMLANEHGNKNYRRMGDIELCTLIDKTLLPERGIESVYTMSLSEKNAIANLLKAQYHIPIAQINRCLAMSYPSGK